VYDKLRAELFSSSSFSDGIALPADLDTSTERVMRLLEPKCAASSDVGDLEHAYSDDGHEVDSNSICILPSSNAASKDIFLKLTER